MVAAPATCFHCGEPLAGRGPLWATIRERDEAFCCPGCQAAAQLIGQLGLSDFYRYRSAPSQRPDGERTAWLAYDADEMVAALTRGTEEARSIVLLVDGLTCAACSWLVTRALLQVDGVARASVNAATGRAQVVWDQRRVPLSRLLGCIDALGYRPRPLTAEAQVRQAGDERHAMLKRLAVAGLGMMQVMMFAVAMYSGDYHGMDPQVRTYLRLVSMLVATPVMLYAGWPFFVAAVRALRSHGISMDVPVSLGMLLAYGASVFNTWRHAGEVYFDSVTMFIFFLTVARYVEMIARHRSNGVTESLSRMLPATAHRQGDDGVLTDVAVAQLARGDRVLVRSGEVVPADGTIVAGSTRVNESMLTGEPLAVLRGSGDRLAAGTVNDGDPVTIRVTATGAATVLANIVSLLGRAQSERPRANSAADVLSSRFLLFVLVAATVVGLAWSWLDPSRAFAATLAVLVASCPCALSLATLVATASATSALARRGVLVTHPDAIEGLARVSRVVFDKTGTLTDGRVTVTDITVCGGRTRDQCLAIAAALEQSSEHPVARSIAALCAAPPQASDVRVAPGQGIEGLVGTVRCRIGTGAFVTGRNAAASGVDDARICLGDDTGLIATFALSDALRADAAPVVRQLRDAGIAVELLSGDSAAAVQRSASQCGIGEFRARQAPADKLRRIEALRGAGDFVAMVGDGINDAPVLGGSGVAVAMGNGSALAQASAGLILVGDRLQGLVDALRVARGTRRIIRQNLAWAVAYNAAAMPLAALGWLPPWMAALGMSLSSITVVLNGMRARRVPVGSADAPVRRGPGSMALVAGSTV